MRKLTLDEFAYPALSASGIGEKNTISNGPDDGTDDCVAGHFWKAKRHTSTKQVIDNALAAALAPQPEGVSAGGLNIGGHGNEGFIETGIGQTGPYDPGTFITSWNEYSWGTELDRIGTHPITYISLWACHPGAGQDGADLLFAMAKRAGRAVRGGTGFLYCSSQRLYWESGSVWQVATPNSKPDPISAPSNHGLAMVDAIFDIAGNEVGADAVTAITIRPVMMGKAQAPARFEGVDAQAIAARLFGSPALDMQVGIAGLVTGTIDVEFGGSRLSFTVYNHRLAVERSTRTGYYIPDLRVIAQLTP